MSFLEKMNAEEIIQEKKESSRPVNPLLKKRPLKASGSAEKKVLTPLKKKEEDSLAESPLSKGQSTLSEVLDENDSSAPLEEAVQKTTKEEVKEEAKEEVKEEAKEEIKEEAKEEVKEEAKEEIKKEAKEEIKKEVKKEVKKEAKEEAKEEVKDEAKEGAKKKAKSSPKRTKAKAAEMPETVLIPVTSMSFSDAAFSVKSGFVDEEWQAFQQEIESELEAIEISDDINAGTLKVVISELSMLREKIWFNYQETKNLFEILSSKEPEGLIERVKRINLGTGSNEMERRRAGVLACMSHSTDNGPVNLYELLDETRTRYNFLRSVIDSIKYKTDVLITLNGALKLEKEHL